MKYCFNCNEGRSVQWSYCAECGRPLTTVPDGYDRGRLPMVDAGEVVILRARHVERVLAKTEAKLREARDIFDIGYYESAATACRVASEGIIKAFLLMTDLSGEDIEDWILREKRERKSGAKATLDLQSKVEFLFVNGFITESIKSKFEAIRLSGNKGGHFDGEVTREDAVASLNGIGVLLASFRLYFEQLAADGSEEWKDVLTRRSTLASKRLEGIRADIVELQRKNGESEAFISRRRNKLSKEEANRNWNEAEKSRAEISEAERIIKERNLTIEEKRILWFELYDDMARILAMVS